MDYNQNRIIPVLLYKENGLFKGIKFKNYKYVGDPHNAIRVFNAKEVDELILLDIEASKIGKGPDVKFIKRVAEECYMPFTFGGGISKLEDIKKVLRAGAEKVCINTSAIDNLKFINEASQTYGKSTIVVSIDYKKGYLGKYFVFSHLRKRKIKINPIDFAKKIEDMGAGELLINSVDNDGTGTGLNIELIKKISSSITIPVIACGGVGNTSHIKSGFEIGGASAVAVGSFFVFRGFERSVLISYTKDYN